MYAKLITNLSNKAMETG